MLSYKEYKELNENLNVPLTLGVKPMQSINSLTSKWDEMGMNVKMPSKMKKKAKKYMADLSAELPGDHEMESPDDMMSPKPSFKKKKPFSLKKKPKRDEFEDDFEEKDEFEDEESFDDEDDFEEKDEFDDEESFDDEEDDFEEKDEFDDEEDDFVPSKKKLKKPLLADKKRPMAPPMSPQGMVPPMKMKKKSKKYFSDNEDFEDVDDLDIEVEDDGDEDFEDLEVVKSKKHDKDCDCKKCCGSYMKKKSVHKKKMKEEYKDFSNSLRKLYGNTNFNYTNDLTVEDAILPPENPNERLISDPEPGEVGYAPQNKLGVYNSRYDEYDPSPFSFYEWTSKHKRNAKRRVKKY